MELYWIPSRKLSNVNGVGDEGFPPDNWTCDNKHSSSVESCKEPEHFKKFKKFSFQ